MTKAIFSYIIPKSIWKEFENNRAVYDIWSDNFILAADKHELQDKNRNLFTFDDLKEDKDFFYKDFLSSFVIFGWDLEGKKKFNV